MSDMHTTKKRGRKPAEPRTARGKQILAHIDRQGLSLYAAARKARLSFVQVYAAIHGDPARLTVKTAAALCGRLGLPLELVAPQLASAIASASVA